MSLLTKSIRKILVLRYRSIGDILLANPALEALRKRFPNAIIDILIDDSFEEILQDNPNVDNIIFHRRNTEGSRLKADFALIKELRNKRYDLAVDLHSGPRGAWATLFSGAKIRVGHHFSIRNTICYNTKAEPPEPDDHTWQVQYKVVRPFEIEWPEKPSFFLSVADDAVSSVKDRLTKAGLMFDRPLVLLHPGARVQFKRWPAISMGKLARWLVDERNSAVILAGSEADVNEIELIRKTSGYALPSFADLALSELTALINMSALVICNDSGPMHMAGVLNIPTVSLFGPSDPTVWGPVGTKNISVICSPPMECMPCFQKGCPYDGDHCMTRIEINDVTKAVDKLKILQIPKAEPQETELS